MQYLEEPQIFECLASVWVKNEECNITHHFVMIYIGAIFW